MKKTVLLTLFCTISLPLIGGTSWAANTELPSLGSETTFGSLAEEKRLGQAWLRLYRRQVPISSDPLLIEYSENLLKNLALHNPNLPSPLSLVVVKNSTLNAFAVPGGIIGLNTGLFSTALTEDQFASVLAHELAHLSQRHYARGVEKQKGQAFINMAAILASLVIAANGNPEAGIAGIQASQARMIDQRLEFSRSFEQEADRLGMKTLVDAGYDPHAMGDMFEQMQRATQFATQPPEFLLTHPVTASRIADADNRAREYPNQNAASSLEYDLLRSRVIFSQEDTVPQAISRFESELRGFSPSVSGSRYGLVLALIAAEDFSRAQTELKKLLADYPSQPALLIAQSDIFAGQQQFTEALGIIDKALESNPNSYSLKIQKALLFSKANQFEESAQLLNQMAEQRPDDPFIWYHLAEISGLAGDIVNLHRARAEYFILYGNFENAKIQLDNIVRKFPNDQKAVQQAKLRLQEMEQIKKDSKL